MSRRIQIFGWRAHPARLLLPAGLLWLLPIVSARGAAPGAQPECPIEPPPSAEPAPAAPSGWFAAWNRMKADLEEKTGTSLSICADEHYQYVVSGPGEGRGRDVFWWTATVRQRLWDGARLVVCARGNSDNNTPPDGITPFVGSDLNLDWAAYETECLYLANVYLEQRLLDDRLLLAAGKMNFPNRFDTNDVAGWDFFSCHLARNAAFPHRYHTVGGLVKYAPTDRVYVQAGVMDAQGIRSETGLNTAFHGEDNLISMYELGLDTCLAGRPGTCRLDLWYDPQPLSRHDGGGSTRDNVGFGVNCDQMVTDRIGVFLRYGWNDGDVRTFGHYWSLGGTWLGPLENRSRDVLGFGFGQGIHSHSYRRANNAASSESIFEVYYKVHVTEYCSLLFDLITLMNAGPDPDNDVGVIPGVRLKFVF